MLARRIRSTRTPKVCIALFIVFSIVCSGLTATAPAMPAWGDNISASSETDTEQTAHKTAENLSAKHARVIYHFVPEEELESQRGAADPDLASYHDESTSITAGEIVEKDGAVLIRANAFPSEMQVETGRATFRVLKDYASSFERGAGVEDLSEVAQYDAESGTVSLPGEYSDCDLTVVWYVPASQQDNEVSLPIIVNKTLDGVHSRTELAHDFAANVQVVNIKLFDDEENAALINEISITQGGQELTSYVYQNGSISLVASPLGGAIEIDLTDFSEPTASKADDEVEVNEDVPLFSFFSAANPAVGERFYLSAGSALIRSCESSTNMATITGWPEKNSTYGFTVHFNSCPNPEVVNADQNHVAPGGTLRTGNGGVYDYTWIKGLHFAWGECYGDVSNNGTGEPVLQSGWVEVTNVDYNTQTVSYRYFLDVCSDIDGHNMQSIVGTFQVHEDLIGYLEIKKKSSLPALTEGNECYSLEGAKYGIYSDEACTKLKDTLTTNAEGSARSRALQVGSYYIKEISAPNGYALDIDAHEVVVAAGKTKNVEMSDVPQSDPTPVLIGKYDSIFPYNGEHNDVQGGASTLENAQFRVQFYPSLDAGSVSGDPARTWVFRTDAHGIINLRNGEGCKVSGDDLFYDSHGFITLPLGTYVISEASAPVGYNKNETVFTKTVSGAQNGPEEVTSYSPPLVSDPIIRGGLEIEKRDAESGLLHPLGGASLDGAVFSITNDNAHPVYVDGILFQPGEVCQYLTINEGKASTATNTLPFGDYSLREVSPGEGYKPTSQTWKFSIEHEGEMVRFCNAGETSNSSAILNQVKRGDLNFIKVREDDGARLGGIPFRLTSRSTDESHILVTDKNGIVDTSSSWNAHSYHTNANDTDELDPEAGIWFGKTETGSITSPRDDLGALPYDDYLLEEMPCEANDGLELVKAELSIYRNDQRLDFGVIENHAPEDPWLSTVATDSFEHDKLLSASSEAVINDHVRYGNLIPGESYTLSATLFDTSSGEQIEGASGRTDFTATGVTGTTEVSIPVNLIGQDAEHIVVYETLLKDDEILLEHHDLRNSEQTVAVAQPRIGTTALDASDGDHNLLNEAGASIVDTVRYYNLIPNEEYVLNGTLMLKQHDEEGKIGATELVDSHGETVHAETSFTPTDPNGQVEVTFSFDASSLEPGEEIVVFEQLMRDDIEVADHRDIEDSLQSVQMVRPTPPDEETHEIVPYSDDPKGNFDKTASFLLPWISLAAVLATGSLVLIVLGYRQRLFAQRVSAAIARNMLNPKGRS